MTDRWHYLHASGGVNRQRGQATDAVHENGVQYSCVVYMM
jgi:hypothetical protein